MLRDYVARIGQPVLGVGSAPFDEMVTSSGALRPTWRSLGPEVFDLQPERLRRLRREIARILSDEGVTYSPRGGPQGPWQLDPLPWVIGADEWTVLEAGLTQRAELLSALLQDLYGPMRVISSGLLPAALVFGHRGFLRSAALRPSAEVDPLMLSATDLGRTAAGQWRVLADRTQAPSGLGYAMANRRVISRVLPEVYREAQLHRMAPYFQALRSALLAAAPIERSSPLVVVLTPGTYAETAYDQSFIASSLGFPLVRSGDLTVRDGVVYLRGPGTLERVDVIVRRVDADWSDPLELRGDSHLGVVGLSQAVRAGSVQVVNGLGASVLENSGLMPYLSDLCQALLDEPLRLTSPATLWLGDPDQLEVALAEPHRFALKAIDDPGRRAMGRMEDLVDVAMAAPHRYVAQELVELSQAPFAVDESIQPARLVLRTFTMRHGSTFRPLMGGLATVLRGDQAISSKDVWVRKAHVGDPDQGLSDILPLTQSTLVEPTVARALDDLLWLGRYSGRAEDMLRLLLQAHALVVDFRERPESNGGQAMRIMNEALDAFSGGPVAGFDDHFRDLLLDVQRPGSVAQSLAGLREAAQGARDQLSADIWLGFGLADRAAQALIQFPYSHQINESATQMLTSMLAVQGVTAQMTRDTGWRMIATGRALERAAHVLRLIDATCTMRRGLDVDRTVLLGVLTVSESAITHRRRHRDDLRLGTVLDLLLLDEGNPRSVAFNLNRLAEHVAALPESTGSTRPERLISDLVEAIRAADLRLLTMVEGAQRRRLAQFVQVQLAALDRLADAVAELHLSGALPAQPFGMTAGMGG